MNEKITSLLLVCLVVLSIVYGCSSTALSRDATESIDAVPSRTTIVTKKTSQNVKLPYPRPNPKILGDPIDDPKPN